MTFRQKQLKDFLNKNTNIFYAYLFYLFIYYVCLYCMHVIFNYNNLILWYIYLFDVFLSYFNIFFVLFCQEKPSNRVVQHFVSLQREL